jgi:hypothetical protein
MYVQLSFHFSLSRLYPGLVDIHPGDESTLKDLTFFIIGLYLCFHLYLIGVYLGIHLLLVDFHPFLVGLYHGFQPSYGGYQSFEIRHNYPSPGFKSDGAQFTIQSNRSINPIQSHF